MRDKLEMTAAAPGSFGVFRIKEGLHITILCDLAHKPEEYGIVLYDSEHTEGVRAPFPKDCRVGNVLSVLLKGYHFRKFSYLLYCNERIYQDAYARQMEKDIWYGQTDKRLLRCSVPMAQYDWQGDAPLKIPYEDCLMYSLHVRGFTKHKSSGVRHKGTYLGLAEKAEYFRELGVTSLLLMPTYEFNELLPAEKKSAGAPAQKINYWGYQRGFYYLPKGAYAYGKDVNTEFRDMVRKLHRNGLEVMLQFYFPPEIRQVEIVEIIKYWVTAYHIDGFHLMGVDMPVALLAQEPLLADTKLLTEHYYHDAVKKSVGSKPQIAWMNDGYQYEMRKFLKGDDNMMNRFLYHIRNSSSEMGIIDYIARWDGMRLMDLVSYDRKHNEKNGEANQDGTDYNCSWNCGMEGRSKRKAVLCLRKKQMMNALTFVMLSQGIPLLYSGDEFGFSQEGNNNPYCQDNAVSWINWNRNEFGSELFAYTKELIRLRKEHRVLRGHTALPAPSEEPSVYPEISFHGKDAWKPDTASSSRCVGIMFCEKDFLLYMGVNMHWEEHTLGLPQLPDGSRWVPLLHTPEQNTELQELLIPPRTVLLYRAQTGFPLTHKKPAQPKGNTSKKEGKKHHAKGMETLQNHHAS